MSHNREKNILLSGHIYLINVFEQFEFHLYAKSLLYTLVVYFFSNTIERFHWAYSREHMAIFGAIFVDNCHMRIATGAAYFANSFTLLLLSRVCKLLSLSQFANLSLSHPQESRSRASIDQSLTCVCMFKYTKQYLKTHTHIRNETSPFMISIRYALFSLSLSCICVWWMCAPSQFKRICNAYECCQFSRDQNQNDINKWQ